MTRAEFISAVKILLTTDATRAGALEFADALIDLGMIDLQSHIPAYRVGHTDIYNPSDLISEYFASKGTLPLECEAREMYILRGKSGTITAVDTSTDQLTVAGHDISSPETESAVVVGVITNSGGAVPAGTTAGRAYFLRPVGEDGISLHPTARDAVDDTNKIDLTDAGSGTNTLDYNRTRHQCIEVGWDDRHSIIQGQVPLNDHLGRVAIDPQGSSFYVYPEIREEDDNGFSYQFELNWDGKKLEWEDSEQVPFVQADTLVVAEFVKARMERQTKRDLPMANSFFATHAQGRRNSFLDAQERGRSKH